MINPSANLPDEIFTALPGLETLLSHTVAIDADRWNRELTTRQLPVPEQFAGLTGRIGISRAELLAIGATDPTTETAMDLFLVTLAWGLGLKGSRLKARLDALTDTPKHAADRLLAAWICVHEEKSADEA